MILLLFRFCYCMTFFYLGAVSAHAVIGHGVVADLTHLTPWLNTFNGMSYWCLEVRWLIGPFISSTQ